MKLDTLEGCIEEVFKWHYVGGSNFSCLLIRLMRKADAENKIILTQAYPMMAVALHMFEMADDYGNSLFREYGFMEKKE